MSKKNKDNVTVIRLASLDRGAQKAPQTFIGVARIDMGDGFEPDYKRRAVWFKKLFESDRFKPGTYQPPRERIGGQLLGATLVRHRLKVFEPFGDGMGEWVEIDPAMRIGEAR